MAQLTCEILTPEQEVYTGEIKSITAPGVDGYFGVLNMHAPLITALGEGELKVTDASGADHFWKVNGGFLEVLDNRVSVMARELEAFTKKRTDWN